MSTVSDEHKKQKVLLVDDDTYLLGLYIRKAKNYDIEFVGVSGAQKALDEMHAGFIPDLLIIDIEMPVMNGFELLEKIREEALAPNAAIIVLTNKYELEFTKKAAEIGVGQYIVKASLTPSEVMKEVFRVLKQKEDVTVK